MISATHQFLFGLLEKTLHPELVLTIPSDLDHKELYKVAVSHGISGLLYYPLKQLTTLDLDLLKKFEDDCFQTVVQSSEQQFQLSIVKEALNLHSINHVLMKGELLRRIYPYPDMRLMGDVDILVNDEDLPRIHALMRNIGFHFMSESENHHVYMKSKLTIEFHQKLMHARHPVFDAFFQSAFNYVEKIEESTYQFTYEYHLVYLIAHIAKHFKSQGSGIRSLFDIAVYLNTYDYLLDYEKVRVYLKQIDLGLFFDTILAFVKKWFRIESKVYDLVHPISDATIDEFTSFIIKCGTYGFGKDNNGEAIAIGIEADTSHTSIKQGRIRHLAKLIFPKASVLKYKYKTLEKHPYLIPWFWFIRIIEILFKKSNKKRRIKNVFSKDQDIKKIMNLYKEIGLL